MDNLFDFFWSATLWGVHRGPVAMIATAVILLAVVWVVDYAATPRR